MMTTKLLLVCCFAFFCLAACRKSENYVAPPASIVLVHAMPQLKPIIPVMGIDTLTSYTSLSTLAYGTATKFSYTGSNIPLYAVKSTNPALSVFRSNYNLASGNIYSLFLSGDTTHPDVTLVQDTVPIITDSSCGVRFINLSPASKPININIKGNGAAKTEFNGIAYKQASTFRLLTPASTAKTYIFEIRHQTNDSLLLTYTWTFSRFRNQTLVFAGAVSAAGKQTALKVFPVNYY